MENIPINKGGHNEQPSAITVRPAPPASMQSIRTKFQLVLLSWAKQTYGEVVMQARYQAFRFIEEALELVQAMGLSYEDVEKAMKWVFDRPRGAVRVEIGDVLISVDILAATQGFETDQCFGDAMERISTLDPVQSAAKDREKIAFGLI